MRLNNKAMAMAGALLWGFGALLAWHYNRFAGHGKAP
jgi:hypothetical protein